MIVTVVTCKDKEEAAKIARHLLEKKLVACAKVMPAAHSLYLWPAGSGKIVKADEVMLIAKTLEGKWEAIEKEVFRLHSYKNPEIYALHASHVSQKYLDWIESELAYFPS